MGVAALDDTRLTGGYRIRHRSSERNFFLSTKVDAHAICLVG
jgi:hypothetical protein